MRVSKRTWHYRYVSWIVAADCGFSHQCDLPPGWSLCQYFWLVVFCLAITPIIALWFLGRWLLYLPILWTAEKWEDVEAVIRQRTGWVKKPPRTEPGLLASWWQAKKDRVCPLIEWTE